MTNFKIETIETLVQDIAKHGFRVFLSGSKTYGFYTDKVGSKVISFGLDGLSIRFSGNYVSSQPCTCGQGWRVSYDPSRNYANLFNDQPPQWATDGHSFVFKTLKKYLSEYGSSSKFVEVQS